MTRRQAIIGAYMMGLAEVSHAFPEQVNQPFKGLQLGKVQQETAVLINMNRDDPDTKVTLLELNFNDVEHPKTPAYGLVIKYKDKTIKITIDEIIEALS